MVPSLYAVNIRLKLKTLIFRETFSCLFGFSVTVGGKRNKEWVLDHFDLAVFTPQAEQLLGEFFGQFREDFV